MSRDTEERYVHIDTGDAPQSPQKTAKAMTPAQKRFYASEQCTIARDALGDLANSSDYNTQSSYFSGSELGFVERHLHYLSTHPATNVAGYLSNLRLMTRIKLRR